MRTDNSSNTYGRYILKNSSINVWEILQYPPSEVLLHYIVGSIVNNSINRGINQEEAQYILEHPHEWYMEQML
jgi:hypothetical protein